MKLKLLGSFFIDNNLVVSENRKIKSSIKDRHKSDISGQPKDRKIIHLSVIKMVYMKLIITKKMILILSILFIIRMDTILTKMMTFNLRLNELILSSVKSTGIFR